MFNTLVGRFGGFAGASRSVVEDLQILVVGGGGAGGHGLGGGNGGGGAGGVAVDSTSATISLLWRWSTSCMGDRHLCFNVNNSSPKGATLAD